MKTIIILFSITISASCSIKNNRTIDDILNSEFRVYQISGHQGPKVNIKEDSLVQFLTALHYNISLTEIESSLKWKPETMEGGINTLIENKLLKPKGDYYQPTLGIITLERGNLLEEKAQKVAHVIADSISNWLPEIQKIHDETNISEQHSFRELSLFSEQCNSG